MPAASTSRRVLVGLVLLALGLLLVLMWPFASQFVTAAAVAGVLIGVEDRLSRRLRGHRQAAATLLVLAVLFAIVLPLGGLLAYLIRGAVVLVGNILDILHSGGISSLVGKLPEWLQSPARWVIGSLQNAASESRGLLDRLGTQGPQAALAVTGAVSATATIVVKTVLFLIALFFFLADGHRLVAWIEEVAPLQEGQAAELLTEFRRTASTVIRSAVLTALVQAVTAFVGYLISGAPQPVLLALVTFFLAFVPAAGAAMVPTITGIVMLFTGHMLGGAFLVAWGLLVVGLVDNVVKPLFIRGGVEIHGAVIFFALLGGIAAFGPVGLIVGPLVVSFFLAIIRIARREEDTTAHLVGPHDEELPHEPTLHA